MTRMILLVAVLTLAGCDMDVHLGNEDGGAGGGAGGGGGTGGGGGALATSRLGFIFVSQTEFDGTQRWGRSASATFWLDGQPIANGGISCVRSSMGGCDIADCTVDGGAFSSDGGQTSSAGNLTIVGANESITLTQSSGTGPYGSILASDGGQWWKGGETFMVTASGASIGVPGFTATFAAPTRITVTQPLGAITMVRGSPFPVAWSPGIGQLKILLSSGGTGPRYVHAICTAASSAGTFTVPAAITQSLPAGMGGLTVSNSNETVTLASGWEIHTVGLSTGPVRGMTIQ